MYKNRTHLPSLRLRRTRCLSWVHEHDVIQGWIMCDLQQQQKKRDDWGWGSSFYCYFDWQLLTGTDGKRKTRQPFAVSPHWNMTYHTERFLHLRPRCKNLWHRFLNIANGQLEKSHWTQVNRFVFLKKSTFEFPRKIRLPWSSLKF